MSDVVTDPLTTPTFGPVCWQLVYSPEREQRQQSADIDCARFRVGRRESAELILRAPQLSGLHAEFVIVGGRLFVRDLASTNGTYVNGKRIGYRDVALRHGDHVRMANVEFLVQRRKSDALPLSKPMPPEPVVEPQPDTAPYVDLSFLFDDDEDWLDLGR